MKSNKGGVALKREAPLFRGFLLELRIVHEKMQLSAKKSWMILNVKNFARSYFCFLIIVAVLVAVVFMSVGNALSSY